MRWILLSLCLLPLLASASILYLRPLTEIKPGELNQLLVDAHVLTHAGNGEIRVVDAQWQPLAGQYVEPPATSRELTLLAVPLHQPASADTPMQLAVERDALVVRLGQPEENQPPVARWLLEVPPEAEGEMLELELVWGQGTHSLLEVEVSASNNLSDWYSRGYATLPPTAANLTEARQQVPLSGQRSRYLLLSHQPRDKIAAPELTSATLKIRPQLPLLEVWATAQVEPLDNGRSLRLTTPATRATSLRYHSESGLFAATISIKSSEEPKYELGQWNIYRTATEILASHPLSLPASGLVELHHSAPLPAGEWQWGWRVRPYLFLPTGPGPYYLAYGQQWQSPATGISSLLPKGEYQLPLVALGAVEMHALETPFPWLNLLLIAALVLAAVAVIAIGISQWRTMQRSHR
ncbi:MAG: hypothetical protein II007_05080 [Gammaproteobacteria bacterium]|nr:hypothetical protein [Gammaproteobacteria bacterium]